VIANRRPLAAVPPPHYDGLMEEVAWVRHLVDRAIERLETEMLDSPLLELDRTELRRLLAEAAFREIRALQSELRRDSGR
jgi:hypothetical protein